MSDYEIVHADDVRDVYAGTTVPGEFRPLSKALGTEQLAGHVTRGTLTMRFGDEVREVASGSAVRVAPRTPRSHRNLGDEPVELWAVSRRIPHRDSVKLDEFWEASPDAAQERPAS